MADRIIKSHPQPGSVSRRKIREAVKVIRNRSKPKPKGKVVLTRKDTASGSKRIAFRVPSPKGVAA